jgi:hypothetical protein
MLEMIKFEVGKRYPLPFRQFDSMTPALDGASLTFTVSMGRPKEKEIMGFRRGQLDYGLYTYEGIPFILCNFKGCAELDSYINMRVEPKEKRDAFLFGEAEANLLQFYLVDNATGILRGTRVIGADTNFVPDIRATCVDQLSRYASSHEIIAVAQTLMSKYTIKDMMQRAKMFTMREVRA